MAPIKKRAPGTPTPRNPYMDGSGLWGTPAINNDMLFGTVGSSGLRQYSGWIREEFLPQLLGRQASRVYREMLDNSATVGAVVFAITQAVRQVDWRVVPKSDDLDAQSAVVFVESCMDDMSHTWNDFVAEQLSMLPYGFAPHEIVYKRRSGKKPRKGTGQQEQPASSKYDDGKVGWRKLALRGQDTVIKWFFDTAGTVTGMTQQPYVGGLINLPIEKLLLFRPRSHKNNPEGYSILRTAYRPWFFTKRLEEQEAIMFERFSGLPKISVPFALMESAQAGDQNAAAMLDAYKTIGRNVRIDDQMCVVLPSDTFMNKDGTPSAVRKYNIEFETPQAGRAAVNANESIGRYKLDIMTCVLADFLTLGHTARGTQSLANTKVDLFFQATEGWVQSNAEVMNRYGLPRLWNLNGFDDETQPDFEPDMPQRVDLDSLGNFVLHVSQAGMTLFPDPEVDRFLREASGMPDITDERAAQLLHAQETTPIPGSAEAQAIETARTEAIAQGADPKGAALRKLIAGSLARRLVSGGYRPDLSGEPKGRKRKPKRSPIRV